MKKNILILGLALLLPQLSQAKTIFVSPNGNDSANGTIEAPLASLPAAYQKVESGDTVYFRGGIYHITDEQVMKFHLFSAKFCLKKVICLKMKYIQFPKRAFWDTPFRCEG